MLDFQSFIIEASLQGHTLQHKGAKGDHIGSLSIIDPWLDVRIFENLDFRMTAYKT